MVSASLFHPNGTKMVVANLAEPVTITINHDPMDSFAALQSEMEGVCEFNASRDTAVPCPDCETALCYSQCCEAACTKDPDCEFLSVARLQCQTFQVCAFLLLC
jgi:hypothetical protein